MQTIRIPVPDQTSLAIITLDQRELQLTLDALSIRAGTLRVRDALGDVRVADTLDELRERFANEAIAAGFVVSFGQVRRPNAFDSADRPTP